MHRLWPTRAATQPLFRRAARDQRGQSVVEFAIVIPILLLLLASAIDLGRLFYAYVAVENAAKEGALVGARSPLCDAPGSSGCGDPNNVVWHVENEAPNLVDAGGASLLSSSVACRKPNGTLVQPINDCVDGDTYQVTVSTPFRLITPILSSLVPSSFTLSRQSQATVITDAFDPSGLEVLVWVSTTNATNAGSIIAACTQADATNAPGYYFQPCQDSTNTGNFLTFPESATVSYRVRVRNSGNINLTGISYTFSQNGTTFAKPATCNSLPTALPAGSAAATCSFTRAATVTSPTQGVNDDVVAVTSSATAQGLTTGTNQTASDVKVVPAPRLAVNLWASQYRLGGTGSGALGLPSYPSGNVTLNRDPASGTPEVANPTVWLYLAVANQGGPASNLSVTVSQNGSAIGLPGCSVPTTLAASGQSGSSFTCIIPRTLSQTQPFAFAASASATNALLVSGTQPSVTATTALCGGSKKVVPDLVDTLLPAADGSTKTVGAARTLWASGGFTGALTTSPAGRPDSASVTDQNVLAYTCQNATQTVRVTAP